MSNNLEVYLQITKEADDIISEMNETGEFNDSDEQQAYFEVLLVRLAYEKGLKDA